MVTFAGNKATPQHPAIQLEGSITVGTTYLGVYTAAQFAATVAAEFGPTNQCLLAIDRLLAQFKGRLNIEAIICALADRGQPILNAFEDVKAFRSLDTATGLQLDKLGELYRETRGGKSDDGYRAFLKTLALIVASTGKADEMLNALIVLDDGFDLSAVSLVPHYPAGFIMTVKVPFPQTSLGVEFARVLRKIVAAGVNFMLIFEYPASTDHFVWSGDAGLGWAELGSESTTGGVWAEAAN